MQELSQAFCLASQCFSNVARDVSERGNPLHRGLRRHVRRRAVTAVRADGEAASAEPKTKTPDQSRSFWTRGLKFGQPTRGDGDDQSFYVQDGDDRIEVMVRTADHTAFDVLLQKTSTQKHAHTQRRQTWTNALSDCRHRSWCMTMVRRNGSLSHILSAASCLPLATAGSSPHPQGGMELVN